MNKPHLRQQFFHLGRIALLAIIWASSSAAANQLPIKNGNAPLPDARQMTHHKSATPQGRAGLMIIAHRGGVVDEHRSENSRAALEEAIRRGYTHVEVDARITGDGHVVCFHDDELSQEAGLEGKVSEMPTNLVTQITLTRSKEKIPTFEEYCKWSSGRINLMVDIKGCPEESINLYVSEIATALKKYDLLESSLILINKTPKNNQEAIAERFRGQAKISWRKSLPATRIASANDADFAHKYYVFGHGDELSQSEVSEFKAMGLAVICSINTNHYKTGDPLRLGALHIETMLNYGVDGLQIDSCYDDALLIHKAP